MGLNFYKISCYLNISLLFVTAWYFSSQTLTFTCGRMGG